MRVFLMALLFVGCGSYDLAAPSNEQLGDNIGKSASGARSYFSDRNVSGEDFQNFQNNGGDDIGEKSNTGRDYMNSKGFSKEENENELLATRNNTGKYANDKRGGLYRKGIREMRHGDSDGNSDTKSDIDDLNDRWDKLEDKLDLIAAISELQGVLIDKNKDRLDALADGLETNGDLIDTIQKLVTQIVNQIKDLKGVDTKKLTTLVEDLTEEVEEAEVVKKKGKAKAAEQKAKAAIKKAEVQAKVAKKKELICKKHAKNKNAKGGPSFCN